MKKYIVLPVIGILLIVVFSLSYLLYDSYQLNKKYEKTINYLIDEDFIAADNFIKENNFSKDVDYTLLQSKISNLPKLRLYDGKAHITLDFNTELYCKRWKPEAEICSKK